MQLPKLYRTVKRLALFDHREICCNTTNFNRKIKMNHHQTKYLLCEIIITDNKADLIVIDRFSNEIEAAKQADKIRADAPDTRFVLLTELNPIYKND